MQRLLILYEKSYQLTSQWRSYFRQRTGYSKSELSELLSYHHAKHDTFQL